MIRQEDWNIYTLPGNPNGLDEWTDYPMISITNDHVFLTINLLKDGETWQAGFIETIIWQMGKTSGYDGAALDVTRIDGITFGDQNIKKSLSSRKCNRDYVRRHLFCL